MTRPPPIPDALSQPFFDGLSAGRLTIQRCAACGLRQLGQERCLGCRSEDLAWEPASGRGRVHSFAVMHAVFHPGFADRVPYVVAQVELAEGPRLLGPVHGIAADRIRAGLEVRAVAAELEPGVFAPAFEPATED